jgi:hypothetical protein
MVGTMNIVIYVCKQLVREKKTINMVSLMMRIIGYVKNVIRNISRKDPFGIISFLQIVLFVNGSSLLSSGQG